MVEALRQLKADINIPNIDGATPLFLASRNGHVHVVEALGRLNADVNMAKRNGCTPLYIAAEQGHVPVIESLARLKANVWTAFSGWSPLKIALHYKHAEAAAALRRAGARE